MAVAVITDAADTMDAVVTAGAAPTVAITDAAPTTDAVPLTVDTADAETSERKAVVHLAAAGVAAVSRRTVVAAPAVVAADSTAVEAAGLMVVAGMAEAIAKTRKS
jgi:hypothetical protein